MFEKRITLIISIRDTIAHMKESFNRLVGFVRQEMATPLYESGVFRVLKLEDSKAKTPKSAEFHKAYPELSDFLLHKESAKKFNVGRLHLDARAVLSKKLASEGESSVKIAHTLRSMIQSGLLDIAKKIKENPNSDLAKIEYFTGFSRFFSAEKLSQELGFEVFDIDDTEEVKFDHASHRRATQTYKILNNGESTSQASIVRKRPAKIGIISRQALLALLEKENNPKI